MMSDVRCGMFDVRAGVRAHLTSNISHFFAGSRVRGGLRGSKGVSYRTTIRPRYRSPALLRP